MFARFYPGARVKSAYEIDYDRLYQKGIRGLIFDIDNTLVPHNAPPDARSIALMERLKIAGFKVMTVSNNHEPRVKSLADVLGIDYIFDAHKPSADGYLRALAKMNISAKEAVLIGDQIFTDVWGANRAGIFSILTEPVDRRTDILRIRIKRVLEKLVLSEYRRKKRPAGAV
ncbi:MAG: YqeG family HAD IIIA-type phosphatase [Eubacteriales bacterium]|nr:YqeG family HAD IIIA-type phosphatase [Eubacteriales bacterium]